MRPTLKLASHQAFTVAFRSGNLMSKEFKTYSKRIAKGISWLSVTNLAIRMAMFEVLQLSGPHLAIRMARFAAPMLSVIV